MEPFQQNLAETFPKDANVVQRSTSGVVHEARLSTLVERPSQRLVSFHAYKSGYSLHDSSWV